MTTAFQRVCLRLAVLAIMLALPHATHAVPADERKWPQLNDGDPRNGVCGEALALATLLYQSDNFYLYALPDLRWANISSTFALRQAELDTSGGDALVVDQSVFRKIPKPTADYTAPRSIYWQIQPSQGLRYVMSEKNFGWGGDQYTLFAINENITPSQFFEGPSREIAFQPVIEETWRPPFMMREPANGGYGPSTWGSPLSLSAIGRSIPSVQPGPSSAVP
jgi:hypothetical protein